MSKRRQDTLIGAVYLLGAIYVLGPLWRSLGQAGLAHSAMDQTQEEWFLSHAAHALMHGENPLFSAIANAPLGVNLAANASVLGLAVPLTPITLLFGAQLSFVIALTAGLAGTAFAWYWLFSRHVVSSRGAAAIGGALCGFAPAMISHADGGHLNFVSLYLVPLILWWVIRLREPGRSVYNGLVLGLLISAQFFIGAEPLLITALGTVVFVLSYAAFQRAHASTWARPFLAGSAVAVGSASLLLAYPIWMAFLGPQSYAGLPHASLIRNDLAALVSPASQSVGAVHPQPQWLAWNLAEQNASFGWPLLALVLTITIWLWRGSVLARAATLTAAAATIASLGKDLHIAGHPTGLPGVWLGFANAPVIESLLPTRLTLIAVPCFAVLLALAADRVAGLTPAIPQLPLRLLASGVLAAALIPVAPTPLAVRDREPVPAFFTQGLWRQYVGPGRSLVSAMPHNNGNPHPMRWQIAAGMGFSNVEGYFVGPVGADRHGWYTPDQRPFSVMMTSVVQDDAPVAVTDEVRREIVTDLRFWRADAVVLAHPVQPLRETLDLLFAPGKRVGEVWVWDVRDLTSVNYSAG